MAPFKDNIDRRVVERIGTLLVQGDRTFPLDRFVADATDGLAALELKARIDHIAGALGRALPSDFSLAAAAVARGVVDAGLDAWEAWPVTMWVSQVGVRHPEVALPLLAQLTSYASAEFAIRPFIDADPVGVHRVFEQWTASPDEHVRRVVSEGSRPLLPWASRLVTTTADPAWAVDLLDRLVGDPSPHVRRSVANHLNDLCKLDPDLAMGIARRWTADSPANVAVVRHGLRTLVKRGDPAALEVIGVAAGAIVEVTSLQVTTPLVLLGEALEFEVVVHNTGTVPTMVVIDYGLHLRRANGSTTRKVFKLRMIDLAANATVTLRRRHSIKPVTVRRYYAGTHLLDVQCNGVTSAEASFELTIP